MNLRYIKRIVEHGNMLEGETHIYETVLQYTKRNIRTDKIEWIDVPLVKKLTLTDVVKSDSEQLCPNCLCKPTQKLGFCNECFDNIYSNA